MTKEQAQRLIQEFGVDELLLNEEDANSLQEANPELLAACKALHEFAFNLEQKEKDKSCPNCHSFDIKEADEQHQSLATKAFFNLALTFPIYWLKKVEKFVKENKKLTEEK